MDECGLSLITTDNFYFNYGLSNDNEIIPLMYYTYSKNKQFLFIFLMKNKVF